MTPITVLLDFPNPVAILQAARRVLRRDSVVVLTVAVVVLRTLQGRIYLLTMVSNLFGNPQLLLPFSLPFDLLSSLKICLPGMGSGRRL